MLGVVESMLVVVCKRMQQLPTVLGPAVHWLWRACVMRVCGPNMEELCKSLLRYASAITEQKNVGSCWFKSLTGFKLCATTPNNKQQSVQKDATWNIQRRCELLANNRELKQRRRGRQRERQKISKPTTFSRASRFFVHFFADYDYDVKVPNLRFVEDATDTRQRTSFSFPELWYSSLAFNSRKIRQHLTKWTRRIKCHTSLKQRKLTF